MIMTCPQSPCENGYNEFLNGKLRDEVLEREIFYTLREAQVIIEERRHEDNTFRPHSSLVYLPPEPEAVLPQFDKTIELWIIIKRIYRMIAQRLT